jgi:hypothetical protein
MYAKTAVLTGVKRLLKLPTPSERDKLKVRALHFGEALFIYAIPPKR